MRILRFGLLAGAAAVAALPAWAPAKAQGAPPVAGPPLGVTGTIRFHGDFPSRYVASRNVEVWLPPGYARDTSARYPVLYVQDGQNVFDPATSLWHVDWGVDETMTALIAAGTIRPAIVVGIWNTALRWREYMPARALGKDSTFDVGVPGVPPVPGPALSDAYLRFVVEELKPFVDSTYRTLPGPANTFLMGSSMGGLVSAYAVMEYPNAFGGAACLSTHWPAAGGAFVEYLRHALPAPATHRFYFDHGTATLDSLYAPYQRRVDDAMQAAGYALGRNWVTRVFPGADHSERSWRARVDVPLVFLLGK